MSRAAVATKSLRTPRDASRKTDLRHCEQEEEDLLAG